jgi:hypothetical protein
MKMVKVLSGFWKVISLKQAFAVGTLWCVSNPDASAQLVSCRQKIAMVYYEYHYDHPAYSEYDGVRNTILAAKPDILIDNTPGGLYGPGNSNSGCIPSYYTPHGIEVYSYITGGYEGTTRDPDTTSLAKNLLRIDAIAADGATGVFLDEVSGTLNSAKRAYIQAIFDRCIAKRLKLILNTGVSTFDTWLFDRCDYIMTDEQYAGRPPSVSELYAIDRVIVITGGVTIQAAAEENTRLAESHSFGFYYPSYDGDYRVWGSWLPAYFESIKQAPVLVSSGNTDIIKGQSTTLSVSGCPFTPKWFSSPSSMTPFAIGDNITVNPEVNTSYYVACKPLCPLLRKEIRVTVCADHQPVSNVLSGQLEVVKAPNTLEVNTKVYSSGNLNIQAGRYILMKPGFLVMEGSVFRAEVKSCKE